MKEAGFGCTSMTSLDSVTSVFLVGMSVMLIFLESKPVMLANMSLEVKVAPAILVSTPMKTAKFL